MFCVSFICLFDQFSCSVVSDSLCPHELQHVKLPCQPPTPKACSNSCPLSQWFHPTLSSSIFSFSSCLQSFPASGSFPVSPFFCIRWPKYWSFTISPSNEYSGLISFRMWAGWISLQFKGLSRVFYNTTVQKHQFFGAQPSSQSNSHIHTWPLEKPKPWLDGPLLTKQCLCFWICYLGWS